LLLYYYKINIEKSAYEGNFVRIKTNNLTYVIFQCNYTILKKAEKSRIEYDDVSAAAADADDNGYDTMIVTIIMMTINSRQL
jgi:uncharacterized protein YutD